MRLQKYIASCGFASRRKAEELIAARKVEVNGLIVTERGIRVGNGDIVKVNGRLAVPEDDKVYIMLNKPVGCVTTADDQFGRKKVTDYVNGINKRIYPVGRLDYNSSGLLILTNDGEIVNKLTHPGKEVEKTYLATVNGAIDEIVKDIFQKGIFINGRKTKPATVEALPAHFTKSGKTRYNCMVKISEGRNRQIRRLFEAANRKVYSLSRTNIGDLSLGSLLPGKWRYLTGDEVKYIYSL